MKTLLYKSWSVNGNEITFTIESIGNGTSSIDVETYTIDQLTKDQLILSKGGYKPEYTKKKRPGCIFRGAGISETGW